MSKGIIVIDAPEKCEDCPCCHTDNYNFYCKQNGNHVDWEARPDWCPIKPLPEHKKVDPFPEDRGLLSEMEVVNIGKQIGWNACLDEMERSHKKMNRDTPQAPVEVDVQPYFRKHFAKQYSCPECHAAVKESYNYCPKCGQSLLWKENKKRP